MSKDQRGIIDIIETMRLPYLRVSVTARCNAACKFCHNEGQIIPKNGRGENVGISEARLSLDDYTIIADTFQGTFNKAKFTGGEPTIISNLEEIIRIFAERDYETSITTNGFLLDEDKQKALRDSGLDKINVSIPSTDPEVYREMFGYTGDLEMVFGNIKTLERYFPKKAKINFMGLRGVTVPSSLEALARISEESGITISCLEPALSRTCQEPISVEVIDYLRRIFGEPEVYVVKDDFTSKRFFKYLDGGVWEVDDFRGREYRSEAFDNDICLECPKEKICVEGPYALRILVNGTAKPCLIRNDNHFPFLRVRRYG